MGKMYPKLLNGSKFLMENAFDAGGATKLNGKRDKINGKRLRCRRRVKIIPIVISTFFCIQHNFLKYKRL